MNECIHIVKTYSCKCGKTYNHMSSLCKHKKTCIEPIILDTNNEVDNSENIIKYLMKENAEFKQLLIDQNKQIIELSKNTRT